MTRNAIPVFSAALLLAGAVFSVEAAAASRDPIGAYTAPARDPVATYNATYVLAEQGDHRAQTKLGFMYATGRGAPQNNVAAVGWYQRAANQGDPMAQYLLGLMYDKGQGVKQNYVLAYMWLNLATAAAPPATRNMSARIRDAVATKLSRAELDQGQWLAVHWRPRPER